MAGRILIADPTATNRIVLKVALSAAHYDAIQADDGTSAVALAQATRPDIIILNAQLPDGDGASFCRTLKRDPVTRAIPVLIVADRGSARAPRLAALEAGADDYIARPIDEIALRAQVRNLMRTRATYDELARRQGTDEALGFGEAAPGFDRPGRIAIIAATPETGLGWRRALGAASANQIEQLSPHQALESAIRQGPADAFVIAADLSARGDGLRLISELRSHPDTRHAVIVIQDEASEPGTVPLALDLGANVVLSGSFDAEEIALRLDRLLARKRETDALRASFDRRLDLAVRDPLTGLYNRRYAEAYLARISKEAERTGKPFALMLLDLDRFKRVNDTHGHSTGDQVLRETARRLMANVREIDLVARHGGEEFLIAMPETSLTTASVAAERLRRVIAEAPMHVTAAGEAIFVTVSIGVALCNCDSTTPPLAALIDEADRALYACKNQGRNQVRFSGRASA
jgi:two-component system cell cycle response regulator